MPRLTVTAALQLVLLLSTVPAQYYISRWSGSTAAQRHQATARLLRHWNEWRALYLSGTVWMDWANQQMENVQSWLGISQGDELQQSLALETMIYDNDQGYFGASKAVRSPRPPYVFLRVGEVVIDRKGYMVGVVVGWDPEMRAPTEWVDRVYANSEAKAENTPHYKVLFSGPGPSSVAIGYLPQTQLQRVTGHRPDIPTLENYFTHFDGERFVMQPWLRQIYPEDGVKDNSFWDPDE